MACTAPPPKHGAGRRTRQTEPPAQAARAVGTPAELTALAGPFAGRMEARLQGYPARAAGLATPAASAWSVGSRQPGSRGDLSTPARGCPETPEFGPEKLMAEQHGAAVQLGEVHSTAVHLEE